MHDAHIQTLLIATHNPGKVAEYAELLIDVPVAAVSLDEVGIDYSVEETGTTFEENAILKAQSYAEASGLLTLADDSGLEVDALGGEPGLYSARYGGPNATDATRYTMLLTRMQSVPDGERQARFRCVIALATPEGDLYLGEGTVEGVITHAPRGDFGFGYDPVFFMPTYGATMAELGPKVKNNISHRARALQAVMPTLKELVGEK
jgi:XTP/dITP diphosphohydrolase